mgnify:CR=1 FL=1
MIQALFEKINGLSKLQLVGLLSIIVVILCKVLHMCCFKKETFESRQSDEDSDMVLRMFYVNWCGHCKTAKPEFVEFSENNKDISTEMIDAEDQANADLVAAHDIKGYPTFILTKNKENIVYEGERTAEGFKQFVESHM